MGEDQQMSVAEIMEWTRLNGLHKGNLEELVPQMLRAICKDEYVDAMEEFVEKFETVEEI